MHAKCPAFSPPFPSPLSSISLNIIVSNLLNQNSVGEELLSTTDENKEKGPLIYFELNWPPFIPTYE